MQRTAIMKRTTAAAALLLLLIPPLARAADVEELVGPPAVTSNGCPADKVWDDQIVAESIGVSVQIVERLRHLRHLSLTRICTLPAKRLKRTISKVQPGPKPDHPWEAAKFRRLQQAGDYRVDTPDGLERALKQRNQLLASTPKVGGLTPGTWTPIGPGNIGGRIRAILTHPTDPNWLLVGSVSGGLWKSSDAGASWAPVNDYMSNVAIDALARDPQNPSRIYAGTGESSAATRGAGIFVSNDNGATWTQMPGTVPDPTLVDRNSDFFYVERIAVHPTNSNIVVAATSGQFSTTGGVWRTLNALSPNPTWSLIYDRRAQDVKFDPSSANRILIGEGPHYYCQPGPLGCTVGPTRPLVGNDGGAVGVINDVTTALTVQPYSYTRVHLNGRLHRRVELAVARANPGVFMAVLDTDGALHTPTAGEFGEIFVSTNSGTSWAYNSNPGHLSDQGWYANAIWIDPTDTRNVVVGGLDLYRTDGAAANWWTANTPLTWVQISQWDAAGSVHADHHGLFEAGQFNGTSNRLMYFGNDGGLYSTSDVRLHTDASSPTGWTNLNNGLAITQFWGGAGKEGYPSAPGTKRVIGGSQDNGSLVAPAAGTSWTTMAPGDGGYAAVDPTDPNTYYGEYIYASIYRTTSNGADYSPYICGGPNPITEAYGDPTNGCTTTGTNQANFIAPFVLDPNSASRMLVGANSLWRTFDLTNSQPDWSVMKPPSPAGDNYISAIAVAPGAGNRVWVGHNNGEVYCTTNAFQTTPTWTQVTLAPARMVLRIMVDPTNDNRVFVTYGGFNAGNVLELTDATQVCKASPTVTDRHGNLPQAPVESIVRHPTNSNWLYVGTEVGVFASIDGGVTWSTTNDGPGSVTVQELFWTSPTKLVAATFGRGMFETTVAPGTVQLSQATATVAELAGTVDLTVTRTAGLAGPVGVSYSTADGTGVAGVNYTAKSGTLSWADSDGASKTISVPILNDGLAAGDKTFTVSLSAPTGGIALGTPSTATVTITDAPAHALSVTIAGTGTGTVGSLPAGMSCAPTCTANFTAGRSVTLTATPAAGSAFTSWSGGGCSGNGTCVVAMSGALTVTAHFALLPSAARLGNISTRGQVLTGDEVMIGGFVIGNGGSKTVVITATGPSLAAFGIANPLQNPTLTLVRSSDQVVLASNDDWGTEPNAAAIQAAGFAPSDPRESAIMVTLPTGAYTVIESGTGLNRTGTGVIAVYEIDRFDIPLVNISTRGRVSTGNDVMIGGFVVQGGEDRTVVVTATGPSLAAFGIANPLPNPTLTIVRASDGVVMATNDNWGASPNAAQISALGFAPSNPLESAVLLRLPPGAYTAIVSDASGQTGVGVVAVFNAN